MGKKDLDWVTLLKKREAFCYIKPTMYNGEKAEIHNMTRSEQIEDEHKGYYFNIRLPANRKISDYTPRIVSLIDDKVSPIEANQIIWNH